MSLGSALIVILTSNAVLATIQYFIIRHFENKDVIKQTLAAVSYNTLADKLDHSLERGYATPEQRRDVKVLYDAYHKNNWNGDMDSRMAKFYALPIKHLDDLYKEVK